MHQKGDFIALAKEVSRNLRFHFWLHLRTLEDVDQEVATLRADGSITSQKSDLPEGLHTDELVQLQDGELGILSTIFVDFGIDEPLFRVNIEEQELEAVETLLMKFRAVQLVRVANDLTEDINTPLFVKEEASLPT